MPYHVSIYCGQSPNALCTHHEEKIEEVVCELNEQCRKTIVNVAYNAQNIASVIAERLSCSSVILLSALEAECDDGKCSSSHHCISSYTAEKIPKMHEAIMRNNFLCNHASSPFVEMSVTYNKIIISNDPSSDRRVRKTSEMKRGVRSMPLQVAHLMVVPLFLQGVEGIVGIVVCANKQQPLATTSKCPGFSVDDYCTNLPLFSFVATSMLLNHHATRYSVLEAQFMRERAVHREELERVKLNTNVFMSTMSHEIRTPLNAISGYNELMLANVGGDETSRFGKWLRKQRDATLTLIQLIANVLDFAKLKTEGVTLDSRPFSVSRAVSRAIDVCTPFFDSKNITMAVSISPDVPDDVVGDEGRFSQVLRNLLSNAIKYTMHGKITVTVSSEVTGSMVDLQISVEDTGRGIPRSMHSEIFNEFRQVRDSISPPVSSTQGVGLGLAICKEIVTLMGGKISVESDGRTGSVFTFNVKLRDSKSMDMMVMRAKRSMEDGAVLIVDDQEVNRILFTKLFLQWGMLPHACSSLDEAMMLLESYPKDYFHIAIIDIELNGESGVQLAQRITKDKSLQNLGIIAASSIGENFPGSDIFDAVHTKPIVKDKLLEDILHILERGVLRAKKKERKRVSPKKEIPAKDRFILVVDDDESCATMCEEQLDQLGYKNHETCFSGAEALKKLAANPEKFSIVLLDVLMPKITGIQVAQSIRVNPAVYGEPFIVAVSADVTEKTRAAVLGAGACTFLSKPVSIKDVRKILLRCDTTRQEKDTITPKKQPRVKKTKKKRSNRVNGTKEGASN